MLVTVQGDGPLQLLGFFPCGPFRNFKDFLALKVKLSFKIYFTCDQGICCMVRHQNAYLDRDYLRNKYIMTQGNVVSLTWCCSSKCNIQLFWRWPEPRRCHVEYPCRQTVMFTLSDSYKKALYVSLRFNQHVKCFPFHINHLQSQ